MKRIQIASEAGVCWIILVILCCLFVYVSATSLRNTDGGKKQNLMVHSHCSFQQINCFKIYEKNIFTDMLKRLLNYFAIVKSLYTMLITTQSSWRFEPISLPGARSWRGLAGPRGELPGGRAQARLPESFSQCHRHLGLRLGS